MSAKKYYYAFNGEIADGCGSFCIVSAGFWQRNKQKELEYTADGNIVDRIEKLGFIESMQNIFEYNTSEYSNDALKEKLSSIKNLFYSDDFQAYLDKYNAGVAAEKAKNSKKNNDNKSNSGAVFDDHESAKQSKPKVKDKQGTGVKQDKTGNPQGGSGKSKSHKRRKKKKV